MFKFADDNNLLAPENSEVSKEGKLAHIQERDRHTCMQNNHQLYAKTTRRRHAQIKSQNLAETDSLRAPHSGCKLNRDDDRSFRSSAHQAFLLAVTCAESSGALSSPD
jgi:predicted ATPase